MKRYFAKSKFTSKRKHSREKIEVFVVFSRDILMCKHFEKTL